MLEKKQEHESIIFLKDDGRSTLFNFKISLSGRGVSYSSKSILLFKKTKHAIIVQSSYETKNKEGDLISVLDTITSLSEVKKFIQDNKEIVENRSFENILDDSPIFIAYMSQSLFINELNLYRIRHNITKRTELSFEEWWSLLANDPDSLVQPSFMVKMSENNGAEHC